MSQPTCSSYHTSEKWAIRGLALLILGLIGLSCFGLTHFVNIDELGLYNPIYMQVQYGRMTYPAYRFFDTMVVHPPLHYLIIAGLMKLGLGLYYAEQIPTFALTVLIVVLMAQGLFPAPVKLGLLGGFFSGSVLFLIAIAYTINPDLHFPFAWILQISAFSLRPDLHLALAWLAGVLALETARLKQWSLPFLGLGGFLLTYTAGLHYFAAPVVVGLVIYAAWMVWQLGWRKAGWRLGALLGGSLLFAIPYLIGFVIPNWGSLTAFVASVRQNVGLLASAQLYLSLYRDLSAYLQQPDQVIPSLAIASSAPLLWLRLPAGLVGVVLLMAVPSLRGLALASLPWMLFIVFGSQGRASGYYYPEFILYGIAVLVWLVSAAGWLLRRLVPVQQQQWILVGLSAALSVMLTSNWVLAFGPQVAIAPRLHEMDIARAANRSIVGDNALVGGRIGMWYVAGATHWYDLSPDLLWANRLSQINLPEYLAQFDAIAEYDHMSHITTNEQQASLASWYVDNTLKLKGFYLAHSHSHLTHLLLSAKASPTLEGYAFSGTTLYHFRERPQGEAVFAALICPVQPAAYAITQPTTAPGFTGKLFLPAQSKEVAAGTLAIEAVQPTSMVRLVLMPRAEFTARQGELLAQCRLHERREGTLTAVEPAQQVAQLQRQDRPIQFYESLPEAKAGQLGQSAAVQPLPTTPLQWRNWQASNPQTQLQPEAQTIRVVTNASTYDFQASSPPIPLSPTETYVGQVDVKITTGGMGLHVVANEGKDVIFSRYWCSPNSDFATKRFLFTPTQATTARIVVSNCSQDEPRVSEFTLKQLNLGQLKSQKTGTGRDR